MSDTNGQIRQVPGAPDDRRAPIGRKTTAGLDWDEFDSRLAAALAAMAPDTFLVLTTPPSDTRAYYAQFAAGGRGGLRVEVVGNDYLDTAWLLTSEQDERLASLSWQCPTPHNTDRNYTRDWPSPAPFPDVAALVVRSLRDVYGIGRPAELSYRCFAGGGRRLPDPLLGIGPEPDAVSAAPARSTDVPRAARLAVERAVAGFLGVEQVVRDRDGDIPVLLGDWRLYVRLHAGPPPTVTVFAPVAGDLVPREALFEAINNLNANTLFARVFLVRGRLFAAADLPAAEIRRVQIAQACRWVAALAQLARTEIAERFAGQPPAPAGPVH